MNELKPIRISGESALIGLHRSNSRYANVLAASVAEVVTIPTGANFVLFSADGNFWANFDVAAAIPATEVADGSASFLNPGLMALDGATTIGLIAASATIVQMSFYA